MIPYPGLNGSSQQDTHLEFIPILPMNLPSSSQRPFIKSAKLPENVVAFLNGKLRVHLSSRFCQTHLNVEIFTSTPIAILLHRRRMSWWHIYADSRALRTIHVNVSRHGSPPNVKATGRPTKEGRNVRRGRIFVRRYVFLCSIVTDRF